MLFYAVLMLVFGIVFHFQAKNAATEAAAESDAELKVALEKKASGKSKFSKLFFVMALVFGGVGVFFMMNM